MKIAITGKGGVGKTTFAGTLSRIFAKEGYKILAVDADPDANLASALGLAEDKIRNITPLSKMKDIIAERTEAASGTFSKMFKLNPKVDDIPKKFCVNHEGVKLLTMGTVKMGGSGCICPEHAFLRALMQHLLIGTKEAIIIDMEAGIEHLGRATADSVDAFISIVEPGKRSVQTLKTTTKLAKDIGVKKIAAVGNKIRSQEDKEFLLEMCEDIPILGFLSYDPCLMEVDRIGKSPYDHCKSYTSQVSKIRFEIENLIHQI